MIKNVLFDLDGTLLPMDQDEFIKSYFSHLVMKFVPLGYDKDKLIKSVFNGTMAMVQNDGKMSNEDVFWDTAAATYSPAILDDKDKFLTLKNVGEVRSIGLINAIELVKHDKVPFDSKLRIGYQIYKKALKNGVLLRPLGNVIYFNPPLIIDDMDFVTDVAFKCTKEILHNN